ncbi:HK97 gp10 family phage protein [Cohnella sp. GCM10012308]|uniref:HK97 gp10 family phage protein n=1 Tax=Cohnella sp. GCM10012308 TaxID=3317329 RepID=UPI003621586C
MARLGDFDFSDMRALQRSLKEIESGFPGFLVECIRELAARLLAKTVARTPVDTGLLRRSWQIGEIKWTPTGIEVEIINPVEYAMYVEHGHRTRDHAGWVDGRFMLTISIQELERELPAFLERKLQQFINRHMR